MVPVIRGSHSPNSDWRRPGEAFILNCGLSLLADLTQLVATHIGKKNETNERKVKKEDNISVDANVNEKVRV